MALLTCYDSADASDLPAGAQVYLGYTDGYVTYDAAVARFPDAVVISITIGGQPNVRMCDVESGAMTYAQGAQWANAECAAGRRPTIYCSLWNKEAIMADLHSPDDVDWFLPMWNGIANVPPGYVGHQYASPTAPPFRKTQGNYDVSVVLDTWAKPTPPAPKTEETDMAAADPISGGTWVVNTEGAVDADPPAPYLGGLNNHPAWKAGGNNDPATGIAFWKGDGTDAEGNGYTITCWPASEPKARFYHFPRSGIYKE